MRFARAKAQLRGFGRTLSFRLGLGYAALFFAGVALLFLAAHALLAAQLDRADRAVVERRLEQSAEQYQVHGLKGLRAWLASPAQVRRSKPFYLRLDDARGHNLLRIIPPEWTAEDLRVADSAALLKKEGWRRHESDQRVDISLASTELSDHTRMNVGQRTASRNRVLADFRKVALLIIIPAALLAFAAASFLTWRLTRPLRQIADCARVIIETGRLDERVPVRETGDELQRLTGLINQMLDRNQTLVRSMKEALDNVAHDLATPLTRLRGTAESALAEPMPDVSSATAALTECIAEADRIQTIVRTLLEVARARSGVMELDLQPVDLGALAASAAALYEDAAAAKGVALEQTADGAGMATADPVQMRRVLANLLDNALRHTEPGGAIVIETRRERDGVSVVVRDTGCGIAPAELPRIWDRLYRSGRNGAATGLGLGLSLVKAFTESNGGRVAVSSREGEGAEFVVTLPAWTASSDRPPRSPPDEPAPGSAG